MPPFALSPKAIERRKARDRRDHLVHLTHLIGLCGAGVAQCCEECYDDQLAEMVAWAKDQPGPLDGEDTGEWWRRIGGQFYEGWYRAAALTIKTLQEA
jgi:hypothetical protein